MLKKMVYVLKKIVGLVVLTVLASALVACSSQKDNPNIITVGTIAGPETQLMEVAKRVAKERYGLDVQIIPFSDYNAPNAALVSGSLDANAFQHQPFLDAQIKQRGYDLVAIGKTFIYPMGIYSKTIKSFAALPDGAKVALPNDPTNEARSLLLLQKAGLITLKADAGVNATPIDITSNPKKLQFIELDAAEMPRALDDVALAAINTNYAVPAHLSPMKDALIYEKADSPFVNIIVVTRVNRNKKQLVQLVKAFQSQPVKEQAQKLFGDAAIAGW